MKLTPLDIHHKEFHRAIRGYNEEEVDKFLDDVAEEFERVFKESIELKEQLEKAKHELDGYQGMEKTLQNTLLTAQKSAEDVTVHAKKEAELVLRDSELKAKEVIQEAYDMKRKYEATLNHLKQAEEDFRNKFKSMLESYMRIADSTAALAEIGTDIPGLNEKTRAFEERPSFVEIEKHSFAEVEKPRISLAKIDEESEEITAEENLDDFLPGSFIAETFVPDDFMSTYGDARDASKNDMPKKKNDDDFEDFGKPRDSMAF
ncbi:MAG: hypothetical protein A2074_06955 [Candidatus Aquicultor primus]|uniref:Cell wall synthesis protein Wag31 n=1 Tax=Candidatus Aquicultor primus TaxID=1797195 RepID=A0A1F2UJY8_9ACTN|nr:MAG: hypothetical protein A2074_06955 [Candidatus Aquicultor primus]HCG98360.1 hypothetical protein [Actinomycetota bacterium]